jgi:hypothetical protein
LKAEKIETNLSLQASLIESMKLEMQEKDKKINELESIIQKLVLKSEKVEDVTGKSIALETSLDAELNTLTI